MGIGCGRPKINNHVEQYAMVIMNIFASFHSVLEPFVYYSVVDPHRFCKRAKVTLESRKNEKISWVEVLDVRSLFRAAGFSYILDVFHRDLGITRNH